MNYSVLIVLARKRTKKWQGTILSTPTGIWNKPWRSTHLIWNGRGRIKLRSSHKICSLDGLRERKLNDTTKCKNYGIRRQTDFGHWLAGYSDKKRNRAVGWDGEGALGKWCKGSVGSSCRPGPSDLSALVFPLEFQELFDDLIGVDLELIGKVGAYFVLELIVFTIELEVALSEEKSTWYFLREDSLSLEGSNRSLTFNLDIATKY